MIPAADAARRPEPSLDATVILDEGDQITWASSDIEVLVGRPASELVGTAGVALVHPGDRESFSRLLGDMHAAPLASSLTVRLVAADDDAVPVEVEASNLVEDAGLSSTSLRLRKLVRTHDPAARPRRRAHRAQTVLDTLQEGVLALLADGTVLSCNEAAPRLLGTTREALVG
ncbi:MAG: PAS domain-containing protein, partial [Acidimicrobiales bacterium]